MSRKFYIIILILFLNFFVWKDFIFFSNGVNYKIDPLKNGKYNLSVTHWSGKNIIRSKYLYDLSMSEIDSVKVIEDGIDLKLRGKYKEYQENLRSRGTY